MEIISREQALTRGLTRYFTGKRCVRGHRAARVVSSFGCVECVRLHRSTPACRAYHRNYRRKNADRFKQVTRIWRSKNREKLRARSKAYNNSEEGRAFKREWQRQNRAARKERRRAPEYIAERKRYMHAYYLKHHEKIKSRARNYHYEGPHNPKGELQWLQKNKAQLRNLRRRIRNFAAARSPSEASPPAHTSPS